MVLQKRLDYGYVGYQIPPIPQATRSARRNGSFGKRVDNQMCAFDLLATVAGKILLEGKCSPNSVGTLVEKKENEVVKKSFKKEEHVKSKPLEVNPCEHGSCNRTFSVSEIVSQAPIICHHAKDFPHAKNHTGSGLVSVISTSNCSGNEQTDVNGESEIKLGSFANQVDVGSSGYRVLADCKLENESRSVGSRVDLGCSGCRIVSGCTLGDENRKQVKFDPSNNGKASVSTRMDIIGSQDLVGCDEKPRARINLDNSVKLSPCMDHISCSSLPLCRGDVKLVVRDDDENSSGYTQPSTANKAYRPPKCSGDRRIRKPLASKYWKVTRKLRDEKGSNADAKINPLYHGKNGYKCQRSQRDYPFKKRTFYGYTSVSISDTGISSDCISSSPGKGYNGDSPRSGATLREATGMPPSIAAKHTTFRSRNSHVKLKIKSFRVPELFIEIPETATVGSLKRTVMEAITAILDGGLHVGVVHQGKKIRDDSKTLLQNGISHDNKLDALGFTLEPNPLQASQSLLEEDRSFPFPCDASQSIIRYPQAPTLVHDTVHLGDSGVSSDPPVTNYRDFIDRVHDSVPSPPYMSMNKGMGDSRAMVAFPATNVEALAVIPMRKSNQSEAMHRRVRRPFSVSEVEALVKAVERLGTGRWRDVKLRAFDNIKHRTYLDLKDKWKTLVHTARISPSRRRGEPVPQGLLDRVLTAHVYWS